MVRAILVLKEHARDLDEYISTRDFHTPAAIVHRDTWRSVSRVSVDRM
jgi:hypothetical protein